MLVDALCSEGLECVRSNLSYFHQEVPAALRRTHEGRHHFCSLLTVLQIKLVVYSGKVLFKRRRICN